MPETTTQTFTTDGVSEALNWAADEVIATCGLPDGGTRDAVNLVVNAAMERLRDRDVTLQQVVERCYDIDPQDLADGSTKLDVAKEWISGR